MSGPVRTATLWGGAGLLGGAAAGVLVMLPFYPDTDDGWAELGWSITVLALGALLAVAAGAVLLRRGLTSTGAEHVGLTTAFFVPTAVLLGGVGAGVGALAAPAVAVWLARGFAGRREGWGPSRQGGVPQRVIVAAVVSAALAGWGINRAGYELGGRIGGVWLAWAVVLPAVVLPPVLLLRRVLPWPWLGALVAVGAALLGVAAPQFTEHVHPTPERLEQIVRDLPVPEGQSVDGVRTAVLPDRWVTPVVALSTGGPAPDPVWSVPADPRGADAARAWEAVLSEQGWKPTPSAQVSPYWLPEPLRSSLLGHAQYELGPWIRASVVPYGDGAALMVSTRP